eukprot:Sdes_comp9431_c0_seq1m894
MIIQSSNESEIQHQEKTKPPDGLSTPAWVKNSKASFQNSRKFFETIGQSSSALPSKTISPSPKVSLVDLPSVSQSWLPNESRPPKNSAPIINNSVFLQDCIKTIQDMTKECCLAIETTKESDRIPLQDDFPLKTSDLKTELNDAK